MKSNIYKKNNVRSLSEAELKSPYFLNTKSTEREKLYLHFLTNIPDLIIK